MTLSKKGIVLEINNKKIYLSQILIFFIMLLFAASLTMNVLFCSNYNLYKLIDKTTVTETWAISERIVSSEDDDDTTCSYPKRVQSAFFLIIVFLYFFSTLFRLLPDEWTLINQKVRLDD